jgi:cytidine deaminase
VGRDGVLLSRLKEAVMQPIAEVDQALIDAARDILKRRFRVDRHEVGAALRTRSGQVFQAVNLDVRLRRASVCAEAVAIGMARAAGDTEIEAIVAVNGAGRVLSPCGPCRELLSDYAPDARVIVPGPRGPEQESIQQLLPRRYNKGGTL